MAEVHFKKLLDGYVTGQLSMPEQEEFFALLEKEENQAALEETLREEWKSGIYEGEESSAVFNLVQSAVLSRINAPSTRSEVKVIPLPGRSLKKYWIAAAAAAVLVVSAGTFWIMRQKDNAVARKEEIKPPVVHDIAPGGDKAVLILADGKHISLDTAANGALARQNGIKVMKSNGHVLYNGEAASRQVMYNTISTPKGGQYQLQLADGSRVWLNAASSLRFPASFPGGERTVELSGEAYFEVAHNAHAPFHVKVGDMDVQVLGTHFNINSYTNEEVTRTTLLQGAVKVTKGKETKLLSPGEQAQATNHTISVRKGIDTAEVIAWKNGLFQFSGAGIDEIMRQVERWYNVSVAYEGEKPGGHYSGKILRDEPASQLLQVLQASGVKCKIDGTKLIVLQ